MKDKIRNGQERPLPKSRLGRFSHVARMVGGVAGGMLAEGARQFGEGKRPKVSDLILTPNNAKRIAQQFSAMRGAAMKIGQLLSMETDGLLPKELSDILAQLRDNALAMPRSQLEQVMISAYGQDWPTQFREFDYAPIAAASIGQVHRAVNLDGEELAIKVQYPGVVESIDSDVDNIAWLLKISKLLPTHMQIDGLLNDAKLQLHEEANYLLEGEHLATFYSTLIEDQRYIVPWYYDRLSTESVLVMEYVASEPLEDIATAAVADRNRVMHNLIELMLRELFDLQLMQTDPNFANYRYVPNTKQIVLLDFGATRQFTVKFTTNYKRLIRAVIAQDDEQIIAAADRIGYHAKAASDEYRAFLVEVFYIALEPFMFDQDFDFAGSQLSERLSELSQRAYGFKEFWQTPPTDILYLHRKLGGMFLLASRLQANVNCHQLVQQWITRLR
jgi:predicted unusual protein kinase regulating ubiquinone biosynthesis (AarF/ABC1/UbiB family)